MSKFKNTEELEKAYKELEKEFTKKSQKLAEAEKTNYVTLLHNEMDSLLNDYAKRRISDLEAKLAESEENNKLLEMQLQDMERSKLSWENQYFTLYNTLKNYREVTEKKHLLNEKEWQDYCAFKHIEPQIKGCLDREREYEKQLAEKEKEIESYEHELEIYKQNDNIYARNMNRLAIRHKQDKISFALEQLEKVRTQFRTKYSWYEEPFRVCEKTDDFVIWLDNQIKAIKGE